VASIHPFLPRGVFGDSATRILGEAFDAACKELHDTGQPEIVREVLAKRIIAEALKGQRSVRRLKEAALAGLSQASNRK
jgi:hypothetical protein